MSHYLVESHDYSIFYAGRDSSGVIAEPKGSPVTYLHVLEIPAAEIAKFTAREDDFGNKDHDRLCLPRTEEWWIAVEGTAAWPKIYRPKRVSHCTDLDARPAPVPLSEDDLTALRQSGVGDVP
ncbi:hypothetical protein JYT22_00700 [Endomicrobium sp. AH-315-J14]|nr:hypothetical protein [Endomicrobium sp. AH-315-J14]